LEERKEVIQVRKACTFRSDESRSIHIAVYSKPHHTTLQYTTAHHTVSYLF
jgi:hypothetical protein